MKNFLNKQAVRISKISMVIVFLALIRIASECMYIVLNAENEVPVLLLYPFLLGSLICSISLLVMVVLHFYAKPHWVTIFAVLTVGSLFIIKYYYLI
ncbi:MAG: hypothetical protein ACHQF2_09090 [Flavobacteriales bacterium]